MSGRRSQFFFKQHSFGTRNGGKQKLQRSTAGPTVAYPHPPKFPPHSPFLHGSICLAPFPLGCRCDGTPSEKSIADVLGVCPNCRLFNFRKDAELQLSRCVFHVSQIMFFWLRLPRRSIELLRVSRSAPMRVLRSADHVFWLHHPRRSAHRQHADRYDGQHIQHCGGDREGMDPAGNHVPGPWSQNEL